MTGTEDDQLERNKLELDGPYRCSNGPDSVSIMVHDSLLIVFKIG